MPTTEWKQEFRILMGKVVGWRNAETDYPLEEFIESLLDQRTKEVIEEIESSEHTEFCTKRGHQYRPCLHCIKQQLKDKHGIN